MGKKKKEIYVPELPEPWKAYYSDKRKRIFYFNVETKQTTWDMPIAENPSRESGLSTKQLDTEGQRRTSDILEKVDVSSRRSLGPWEADEKKTSDKLGCLHGLDIPNTSEASEELMEIDEISMEGINCHEEPMEIDFVVEEVQAFRREHFLHPNLFAESNISLFNAPKNTGACGTTENAGMVLIVFDTSCLLQDTALLPMCIQRVCYSLIPYTVLQELDGLKKAKSDELRSKAGKTIAYLHDCIKRGCNYLFIENTFEASNGMEEFGCQNNDDIILKCAFVTTRKYENEPVRVVFATNDKNLAVKAAAHNIVAADRNELLHLLATNPPKGERQQLITRNTQKITPADFSFTIVDKPSSSAVKTMQVAVPKKAVDRLRASPKCHSSSPSSTLIPQTRETSSYIGSVLSVAGGKDESRNFIRRKKGSCGASSSAEHREVHQLRSVPYSNRKVEKEDSGSGGKLSKKRRLCKLNGHSMDDFLEIFAELVQHLQRRGDRKSVEDRRRINKVIDSVIANESSSLSVLVDIVSKFYDFYANCDVFISAVGLRLYSYAVLDLQKITLGLLGLNEQTHFDKKQLSNQYESSTSTIKEKLRTFQKQLVIHPDIV